MFFFLFYSNFKILLLNCQLANICFVDHFDQFLDLFEVHVFQFNRQFRFLFEMGAKVRKSISVYKDFFSPFYQKRAEINQKWPKIG
jgi:hypothetical protein